MTVYVYIYAHMYNIDIYTYLYKCNTHTYIYNYNYIHVYLCICILQLDMIGYVCIYNYLNISNALIMHISTFSALIISNIPGHPIYSSPRMFDDSLSCATLPPCCDGYLSPSPLSSTPLGAEFQRKSPLELTVLAGLFENWVHPSN